MFRALLLCPPMKELPLFGRFRRLKAGGASRSSVAGMNLWVSLAMILTGLNLLPIWLVRFPPLQDYPYHLLRTHIIANYSNPAYGYPEKYVLNFFPSPYSFVDYLVVILNWIFTLQFSWKLILSLYIILFPWSIFYLIRSVNEQKTILGFFSFLFVYSWYFNMGFVNFVFSLPFFFFTLGFWWRSQNRLTWKREVLLCVLIVCVYLSHFITYVILIFTFTILMVLASRSIHRHMPGGMVHLCSCTTV